MTTIPLRPVYVTAVAAVLLLAGGGAGYWWAHRAADDTAAAARPADAGGTDTSASAAAGRRILYWHDPMMPNARFDKPGKSPFMDMDLVPVYADEAGESGDVRVSANVTQSLGIRLGKVEMAALGGKLRAVGNVAFNEELIEVVQARVEGYVTRLYVKTPLERVRRGERLAEIEAPAWIEAQQEYLALLDAGSERAQSVRDAARGRLGLLGVPAATIREIETRRQPVATTTLTAPIDGAVTELGVRDGAAFMSGELLFRINGLSTVWVNAQIPEAHVSRVPAGSGVEARAAAWPGEVFRGRVIALLPEVDPQTRTLTARVALENPGYRLASGMYVALEFGGPDEEPQLVVPSEAVITTGERSVVIVARGDGAFDVAEVSVGAERGGRTAILAGLQEAQSIVLSGQFLIDSEASLKSTVNRLERNAAPAAEQKP